jgi:hypothetical protein
MNAKMILISALLAVAGGASNVALAQDGGQSRGDRMARMQGMMEDFEQADAAERRMLMHEHMSLMREQMTEMQGMMDHGAQGEATPDMTAMQQHMGMMQGMMMQMMAQQDMMMRMQESEEPPADEDGE